MKYLGCAYYPEVWPRERWPEDVKMMKDAGFNLVRLAEFAWSVMEPEEGRFDFEWLHRISDLFHENGIKVMLCTPTAAAPPWLAQRYPETVWRNQAQPRPAIDIRRRYCPSSESYRRLGARLIREMAREFADHPAVSAWQIDNEIAIGENPSCECESCVAAFRSWLEKRYTSLQRLNQAWGNRFWSAEFTDWNQILPPFFRESAKLDWLIFQSELFGMMIDEQSRILRSLNPAWRLTANLWINTDYNLNLERLCRNLDAAAYDCYIHYHGNLQNYRAAWDMYRNIKHQPFIIAETGAWNHLTTGADPSRALRSWAWEFLARGADTLLYFRWRQSLMGEENHPAILPWSGNVSDAYKQICRLSEEFARLKESLSSLPLPDAKAAILLSPAVSMLYQCRKDKTYSDTLARADHLLNRFAVTPDILSVNDYRDLRQYRLIVLPMLELINDELADRLRQFVAAGGILYAQTRLALLDENGKYLPSSAPCGLQDLFGLTIDEHCGINNTPRYPEPGQSGLLSAAPARVSAEWNCMELQCVGEMEKIVPSADCFVLGRFSSGAYTGMPFLTEHVYGQGRAIYQSSLLEGDSATAVIHFLIGLAGLNSSAYLPAELAVIKRGNLRFYINTSDRYHELKLVADGKVLLGNCTDGKVIMPAYEIVIVEES